MWSVLQDTYLVYVSVVDPPRVLQEDLINRVICSLHIGEDVLGGHTCRVVRTGT
jgi:hypothetical protein